MHMAADMTNIVCFTSPYQKLYLAKWQLSDCGFMLSAPRLHYLTLGGDMLGGGNECGGTATYRRPRH